MRIPGIIGAVALLSLTAYADEPRIPFGSRSQLYVPHTLSPSGSPQELDEAVVSYYRKWKAAYLVPVGRWQAIRSLEASHPFVAEGQGYGLMIFALMDGADPSAKDCFDAVLGYVLDHPSSLNPALMASEQNESGVSVNGSDSATDGDLDIAYSLLLADRQWGSAGKIDYKHLALERIHAIKQSEIHPQTHLPLLGDWSTSGENTYTSTRPSDFTIDHFRAFRAATGEPFWDSVLKASHRLITLLQKKCAPTTSLIPDFVVHTDTPDPQPAPAGFLEDKTDGQYSFNAARVPWRLGTDALVYGDETSRIQARLISDWFRRESGDNPHKIGSGYSLSGRVLDPHPDPVFIATLSPAAMLDSSAQPWLDALWRYMVAEAKRDEMAGYFGSTLMLHCMIVASGNYWSPVRGPL